MLSIATRVNNDEDFDKVAALLNTYHITWNSGCTFTLDKWRRIGGRYPDCIILNFPEYNGALHSGGIDTDYKLTAFPEFRDAVVAYYDPTIKC